MQPDEAPPEHPAADAAAPQAEPERVLLHMPVDVRSASLVVIAAALTITTIASLVKVRRDPSARAHAGSLRAHPPDDGARPEPPRL